MKKCDCMGFTDNILLRSTHATWYNTCYVNGQYMGCYAYGDCNGYTAHICALYSHYSVCCVYENRPFPAKINSSIILYNIYIMGKSKLKFGHGCVNRVELTCVHTFMFVWSRTWSWQSRGAWRFRNEETSGHNTLADVRNVIIGLEVFAHAFFTCVERSDGRLLAAGCHCHSRCGITVIAGEKNGTRST